MTEIPTRSITQLPQASSVSTVDVIPIQQNGITKQAPLSLIFGGSDIPSVLGYAALRAYYPSTATVNPGTVILLRGVNTVGVGDGFFFYDNTSSASDNGGTVIVDSANRRWVRQYEGPYSIDWWGADPSGSLDSGVAIRNTWAAFASAGGAATGVGTYSLSAAVTLGQAGSLLGNKSNFYLRSTTSTANTLFVDSGYVNIIGTSFIHAVSKTAGHAVYQTSAATNLYVSEFYIGGANGGIRAVADRTLIHNGEIRDCTTSTGIGIQVDDGVNVEIESVLIDSSTRYSAGIRVTKCDDLTISTTQCIAADDGLILAPGNGATVPSVYCVNSYFDQNVRGINFSPTGTGTIARSFFSNIWAGGNFSHNIYFTGTGETTGVVFENAGIYGAGSRGVFIENTRTNNIQFSSCEISGNTTSGFETAAGVSSFSIQDCRIGPTSTYGSNSFGIALASANTNYRIIGNDVRGNSTNISGVTSTSPTELVDNNLGYVTYNRSFINNLTTDASGDLVVTHGLATTPTFVNVQVRRNTEYTCNYFANGASTFTVRFFNAGVTAASTALTASWEAGF